MVTTNTSSAPSILLAEDEETEVMLFELALQSAGPQYPLIVTRDGKEAIDYLSGEPPYSERSAHPMPGLMVLDLKMPRLTGFDVLSWLEARPHLRSIPAVVLSSSSYPEDIQKAARLGAREYYIKPHSLSELGKLLRSIIDRWLPPQS
jgi:CheY-like chemotaxis protein